MAFDRRTRFSKSNFLGFVLLIAGLFAQNGFAQRPIGETVQKPLQVRSLADSKVALQNGAMTSAIPFELPAFHGITPELSLSYSSSAGNGFVGAGWELQGFPVIERASPNRGSPRYSQPNANDIYLFNGEELVPSTNLGGTHATRRQSYLRIVASADGATWTVTQRDGTTMLFTRVFGAGTKTFRWGLTKVQDTHGNVVNFAWQCETTLTSFPISYLPLDCYPSSISYGPTTVTLYKESRPDPQTFAMGYTLGRSNFRLKSIVVNNSGSLLRAYKVSYVTSARNGQSLLRTSQQFGWNATVSGTGDVSGGVSLPPTTVTVTEASSGLQTAVTISGLYGLTLADWQSSELTTDDFNGDGRMDMLLIRRYPISQQEARAYLLLANSTGGFVNARNITSESGMSSVFWLYAGVQASGDLNGDGVADLLIRSTQSPSGYHQMYRLLGSTSSTFATIVDITSSYGLSTNIWTYAGVRLADFNGDGKADLLLQTVQGTFSFNYLLTASTSGNFNNAVEATNLYGMNWDKWNSTTTLGDFNGDGKTDLILRHGIYNTYYLQASPSGGFNTVVDITTMYGLTGERWGWSELVPGDFNGDGRTDLLIAPNYQQPQPYVILYAQGSDAGTSAWQTFAFAPPVSVTTLAGMTYDKWQNALILGGDFNGDGRTDLLVRSEISNTNQQDPTVLLFSTGTGFLTALDVTTQYGMTAKWWAYSDFRIADYDGDGDDDVFRHSFVGGGVYASMPQQILKANGTSANLVSKIENGFGGSTTISYLPSTSWVNTNNPPRTQTVASTVTADGRGWTSTTNYSYQGGMWDGDERRHLGFGFVKSTDPTGAYAESFFYQGATYRTGELQEFVQRNAANGVMTRTTRVLSTPTPAAPWARNLVQQDDYEYNGDTSFKQTRKGMQYDIYGNVSTLVEYGDVGLSSDDRSTVVDRYPNTTAYIVDKPAVASVYTVDAAVTLLSSNRTYYDGAALAVPATKGDVTRMEKWLDTAGGFVNATFAYDGYGNQTSSTDALGHSSSVTWPGPWGLFPSLKTNALGHTSTSVWHTVCGTQTSETDVNSAVTTWAYDELCRPKTQYFPNSRVTGWDYIGFGNPGSQYVAQTDFNTPTDALWQRRYFDGLGREWRVQNSVGEAVDTTYDSRGLVASVSAPYASGETPKLTTSTYDALGRATLVTLPGGATQRTQFGDWSVTTCDALDKPTTHTRDAYGQVIKVREYEGIGCSVAPSCTIGQNCFDTDVTYDLLGRRTLVKDAIGGLTATTFDSLGRRTRILDPDRGTIDYKYDDDNNLIERTSGESLGFAYDSLHRMAGRIIPNGGNPIQLVTYRYDEPGHGAGIGRRTSMADRSGSTSTNYDVMGHEIAQIKSIGGNPSYSTAHAYDAFGRETSATYPDGEVVPRSYDAAGRLATVGSYVTGATYDARGNLKTRTLGNGVQDVIAYHPDRFWITNVKAMGGSTLLFNIDLVRNGRGELTSRSNPVVAVQDQWTYQYDDRRRLVNATNLLNGSVSQSFTYDAMGRMTFQTGVGAYAYRPLGMVPQNAPVTVNGLVTSYDSEGNWLTGFGGSADYDRWEDQQAAQVNSVRMYYDGDGVRVETLHSSVVDYVSNNYEKNVTSGESTNYILFNDSMVARKRGGVVSYYHQDQLGSIAAMSNTSGVIVLNKSYTPFGRVLAEPGLADPFGIGGQRMDITGLYNMGARQMAPGIGMFISPDPSDSPNPEIPQTLNRFAYANNSPINLFDPTGFAAQAKESGYDRFSFWAHNGLSVSGAVPVLGVVPDVVDLVYTAVEVPFGKSTKTDLALATAGVAATLIPVAIDQLAGAAKVSTRVARRTEALSNAELVQSLATRAEAWGTRRGYGLGHVAGSKKHKHAEDLLKKYQRRYGSNLDLRAETSWIGGNVAYYGEKGSARLDVWDTTSNIVYDYKFGNAVLSSKQADKIMSQGPNTIQQVIEVKPK